MNVGIVGLGLIGGSLGLELRSLGHYVLGVSRREETCQLARRQEAVDEASAKLAPLANAEIVFICTPLAAIAPTLEQLLPYLNPETVLTDVASVKMPVVETVSPKWSNFVGGHPMTGTAEQGIAAAQIGLFTETPYVLTPTETTPKAALRQVETVARSLGSQIYFCPPQDHDRAVAWISHLPVMVSASLIAACRSESNPAILELAQQLASFGFRDTSRVGGGNPELGVMMARYNRQELLRSLGQYRQSLDQLMSLIEQEDGQALEQLLQSTNQARPQFFSRKHHTGNPSNTTLGG